MLAHLVEFELLEAQVGDLFLQVLAHIDLRQATLLLTQDTRQQDAALDGLDLLAHGALDLGDAVELGAHLQPIANHGVDAIGDRQQLAAEFAVAVEHLLEDGVVGQRGILATGGIGDGLLGLVAALVVDQRLDLLQVLLQIGDLTAVEGLAHLGQLTQQRA